MSDHHFEPIFIGVGAPPKPLSAAQAGSKAAQLARMSALGLNVPPAFVLPTSLCAGIVAEDDAALRALRKGVVAGIEGLEAATGARFGDSRSPLFVSVRSGAEKSMPGMLETILDVGMNNASLHGLIRTTGNPRLAFDSYRRFLQSFAEVVGGAAVGPFEAALAQMVQAEGVADESELDPEALERLTVQFLEIAEGLSAAAPDDPTEQLMRAARAVYQSWESPRAKEYRRLNALEDLQGTAVTVQAMVFGNAGGDSGAGVAFSRDPATGAKGLYVDFLADAQGEDVVSGRRTPSDAALLASRMPKIARELEQGAQTLEKACRDVQDIEFTVERGRLFFLQTRAAKRTPRAALKIAVDLVEEGLIDCKLALERVAGIDPAQAGAGRFVQSAPALAKAVPASPGVACGRVCFTSEQAQATARSEPAILVRRDTSTEDVAGFAAAAGILTAIGGRTAHAAVVARQMGKVCLVGCRALVISADQSHASLGGQELRQGDWIALDGASGEISLGRRDIAVETPVEYAKIQQWMDERRDSAIL
ncbi:PEP/pyruvate-binding domain-containing protein [Rhodoblastus sp. 17X3]|uniref:PEP/pyruvate-binding domain-containing protein n=1 Tax=Rhodoblastus sp. 17X3 TaxID=3047026 RepID=UPI0024B738AC|nr:PEP/pyruvate-binding domain-containing protein [Rhodoblastus sp. 17X3]MDI9849636.1 PEP/pyruvate-binding domain-containing protein [Rhodoblastus sp. 17X3]